MEVCAERDDVADVEEFWLAPSAYWMPAHFPVSAWTTHAPFAQWLVSALRPASVVELGTHLGYSCFVFAEAARRLRTQTVVSALDTWEGDAHAGFYGPDVFEYVRSTTERCYADSVRLIRGRFSDSRPEIPDHSVDILHIDGRHGYEDVRADFEEWRSSVRDGGVVLFHDIAERENGFGVWRLWEEVSDPGRFFAFEHGHGLGVLGIGESQHPLLTQLFAADAALRDRIRSDFFELGQAVQRQAWLESLPAELERVWAEVRQRAMHETQLSEALEGQSAFVGQLLGSRSWRATAPLRAAARVLQRK